MVLPWALPTASATVTSGVTAELVNPEQSIREASSAVPIFGFAMTADTAESLYSINITFTGSGFQAGDGMDLAALRTDSSDSGVGLYRDIGSADDELDAGDRPVLFDDIGWSGTDVMIDLSGGGESLPATTVGTYTWLVVVRTSSNGAVLHEGDRISGRIWANNILATDAGGLAYQPGSDVTTDAFIARLSRTTNMAPYPNNFIGPSSVELNELATNGLRIVDGGGGVNSGIDDGITSLELRLSTNAGVVTWYDFAPISTNGATSGIAMYWDDGTDDDEWDATDAPITLGSISPTAFGPESPQTFAITFAPPLAVPDDATGLFDLMVVVRSGSIVTGDWFTLRFEAGTVMVSGALNEDADHSSLFSGLVTSSQVRGDDTPPMLTGIMWYDSSPFLSSWASTLYFSTQMVAQQDAIIYGYVEDEQSGTRNVTWPDHPGLAQSPTVTPVARNINSRTYFEDYYGFNSSSVDTGSPVDFVAYDWVGNSVTATEEGFTMAYMHREQPILLEPTPGWYYADYPMYIDPDGVLWFSDEIYSTAEAWFEVQAVSLYGGGIRSATISAEPGMGAPLSTTQTFGPSVFSPTIEGSFDLRANSTTDGMVTVSVTDQSGQTASIDLEVRKDTQAPDIVILAPGGPAPLTGSVRVRAQVTDMGAGIEWVGIGVDPDNGTWDMILDGTEWVFDLQSNFFSDGPHTLIVYAGDNVQNERAVSVNVMFGNGVFDNVPPRITLMAPGEGAGVDGTVSVSATATDNAGVDSVWVRLGGGAPEQATFNPATGRYEYDWDSTVVSDGPATLVVTVRDVFGNEASASVSVNVDNTAPAASISGPGPSEQVAGTYVVRVFAGDDGGVKTVTLAIAGRTVDMAYNPSTGYYEYVMDTRSLKDGSYQAMATVTDESGKSTSTAAVDFKVQNADTWRSIRESTNFLFLLFVIAAFVSLLMLARKGTLQAWMRGTGAAAAAAKPAEEERKKGAPEDEFRPPKSL